MDKPNERLIQLYHSLLSHEISREELQEFVELAALPEKEVLLYSLMDEVYNEVEAIEVLRLQPSVKPIKDKKWWRIAAVAACITGLMVAGGFWLYENGKPQAPVEKSLVSHDVKAPETNKARITLADGRTVYLDSVANGQLAVQGQVKLVKLPNGQISYELVGGSDETALTSYHTLSNPKGSRVIDLVLSDGSRVWLNAGSSVSYPMAFGSGERKLSITGEAYFEVAKTGKPFIVQTRTDKIEVLGTHFNINAYEDETVVRTTLLEGKVKIGEAFLRPGQQYVNGKLFAVDPDAVMAWKNGEFQFGEKTEIESIMRQIARWYDVEVVYKGVVRGHIGGAISRNVNVSQVLQMLEKTGAVRFIIENRKITVMVP